MFVPSLSHTTFAVQPGRYLLLGSSMRPHGRWLAETDPLLKAVSLRRASCPPRKTEPNRTKRAMVQCEDVENTANKGATSALEQRVGVVRCSVILVRQSPASRLPGLNSQALQDIELKRE